MSDFSLTRFEEFDPDLGSKFKSDEGKLRIVKIIFLILCFLLLLEVIAYKMILPAMRYPKITFDGFSMYTEQDLQNVLYPLSDQSWLHFKSSQAASLLLATSGIESVSVAKHFPDSIFISVTERKPVAMTFLTTENGSIPVQIDKNGVLFVITDYKRSCDKLVPIVSGLPLERFEDGMRIPSKYRTLIERLAEIRGLTQNYLAAVSEICIVPKEQGNYELVVFPANSRVRVLIDRALSQEALQHMLVVLDVVESIDPNVSEIDLRYGAVSYRSNTGRDQI